MRSFASDARSAGDGPLRATHHPDSEVFRILMPRSRSSRNIALADNRLVVDASLSDLKLNVKIYSVRDSEGQVDITARPS